MATKLSGPELIEEVVALIPDPRANLGLDHGMLAPKVPQPGAGVRYGEPSVVWIAPDWTILALVAQRPTDS